MRQIISGASVLFLIISVALAQPAAAAAPVVKDAPPATVATPADKETAPAAKDAASFSCARKSSRIIECKFKLDSPIASDQALKTIGEITAGQKGVVGPVSCEINPAAGSATCSARSARGIRYFLSSAGGWSATELSDKLTLASNWIIGSVLALFGLFCAGNPKKKGVIKLLSKTADNKLSLGRVSFWIVFLAAMNKFAVSGGGITREHETLLIYLLAYNLGQKGIDVWADITKTGAQSSTKKKPGNTAGAASAPPAKQPGANDGGDGGLDA